MKSSALAVGMGSTDFPGWLQGKKITTNFTCTVHNLLYTGLLKFKTQCTKGIAERVNEPEKLFWHLVGPILWSWVPWVHFKSLTRLGWTVPSSPIYGSKVCYDMSPTFVSGQRDPPEEHSDCLSKTQTYVFRLLVSSIFYQRDVDGLFATCTFYWSHVRSWFGFFP